MKAADTAPSPRSTRSAFGIVKATKNASVAPRPKLAAMTASRTAPRSREDRVPEATMPARRAISVRA